ncbi:MAG: outer membrane protein [Afipia sp.]
MKRIVFATTLIALSSASAMAADLPARTYTKAPPIVASDWTGFYAGVNVGYGITDSAATSSVSPAPGVIFATTAGNVSAGGVIGGFQAGYNWQVAPTWVFGLEADIQGADQKGGISGSTILLGPNNFFATDSRLNYFGTVRARLGWLANPSTLLYATGGFAYGETELNLNRNLVSAGGLATSVSSRRTDTGWTVGGGLETKIWGNWTAKAEYLYVQLDNRSASVLDAGAGLTQIGSVDFKDHIVRVGVNYKFGNF